MSSQPPQQPSSSLASRQSGKTMTTLALVVSFLANAATVWGFLVNQKLGLILAAAAIIIGVTVIVREWNQPPAAKVTAAWVSVALGVMIAIITLVPFDLSSRPGPVPGPTVSPVPTTSMSRVLPSPPPSPLSTTVIPPPSSQPPALFDGEVRLEVKSGVDIEAGQTTGVYAEGLSGGADLYLDWLNIVQVSGDGTYSYKEFERNAQTRCREIIDSGRPPEPIFPLATPGNATQFCFLTSEGRLGWAKVRESTIINYNTARYVVMKVRVWP